jgi:hypothetical protein
MTYYHFEGSLVQPTMEMPSGVDFSFQTNGVENYFTAKSKWETHLRSLPKIKVEGKLKEGWVEEGKDFVLEPKFVEYYPDRNPLGDTGANDLSHGSGYERIAVPVSETEANAETVEKKEDEIERLKKLLRMTDCPEALINGEITFKIQPVSELTGEAKEWADREIKKYEKSLQEGQEGAKEVNGNCKCSPDEKHGQTSVMCCNRCGLPDEDYWEVPANLAASKDYAKGLLEWASGKFVQYVPGIWTHTYDKIEYTTTELLKEYDKYLNS